MKIKTIYYTLLCLFVLVISACTEDTNNWELDPSHDRLFRTTKFEVADVQSTNVMLSYRGVTDATKYIFEFSEGDSLLFNSIVKTIEILADTLTPYRKETTAVKTEYRTLFHELNGTTRYSVRVKAINENAATESGFVGVSFITPDEQIFTQITPGVNDVILNWESDKTVTHLRVGELRNDTIWSDVYKLTDAMKEAGEATVPELKPGITYVAQIFNDKVRRGFQKFTTLGSASGTTIVVRPGDNVSDLLATVSATDATLVFNGGVAYNVDEINIPENIKNLYISGSTVAGKQAEIVMKKLNLSAPMENIYFQYVDINNDMQSTFLIEINNANCFKNVRFMGCTVRNIQRSLVRVNSADADIEGIEVNNSTLNNIGSGGYGLFNIGKAKSLQLISVTNSTMVDMGDQLMDVRLAVDNIIISKSIFCNYTLSMAKWLRLDKQPKAISVTSMIFTGDNAGAKMNSGNKDYSAWLDFSGCYLTSDFLVNDIEFFNAKRLTMSSEELFVDSHNGDFHIKEGVDFEGAGKVGDPKWWN